MINVYVAGAYSGPNVISVLKNIRKGIKLSAKVLKLNLAPYCPWSDCLISIVDGEGISLETYYAFSIEFLRRADCMLLVKGWEDSIGTQREIEYADEMGIPIFTSLKELVLAIKNGEIKEVEIIRDGT